jgi:N-glycosylase/DNA lyase
MRQQSARDRLYEIWVPGLGMKESSHFLRNIGHGDDLAILDVRILRKLQEFGVIKAVRETLTPGQYISIEEKMRQWAKEIDIPLGELDLLLWTEGDAQILETLK